jgi:hypothetical protein
VAAQSGVTAIAAGALHTVALKTSGAVVAWGGNASGQTTVPIAAQSGVVAIAAGAHHTVALKKDGSVLAWGYNYFGQTDVPVAAQSGVAAISAKGYHTVALKTNGLVLAWGYNEYGQTNVPSGLAGVTAIAAGGFNTVALLGTGAVAPVSLSLKLSDYGLILSWPTNAVGFTLQSATNLAPPVTWIDSTSPPAVVGAEFTVTNPISGPSQFYRLRKP